MKKVNHVELAMEFIRLRHVLNAVQPQKKSTVLWAKQEFDRLSKLVR
jgi:hypothetical protein